MKSNLFDRSSNRFDLTKRLIFTLILSLAIPQYFNLEEAKAVNCSPTQTRVGNTIIQSFTSTTTCDWTVPAGVTSIRYLVVGGGGSGGSGRGGGGGAGGLLRGNSAVTANQTLEIKVGVGGAGSATVGSNTNGDTSSITTLSLIAPGGGKGGSHRNAGTNDDAIEGGSSGGSGGGGSINYGASGNLGGSAIGGSVIGFRGAGSNSDLCASRGTNNNLNRNTGGGGGAGSAGTIGCNTTSGVEGGTAPNGGNGLADTITGTSVTYATGGGGAGGRGQDTQGGTCEAGFFSSGSGEGGSSNINGGRGQDCDSELSAAVANRGAGGGGVTRGAGGNGGSGIVIVSYSMPITTSNSSTLSVSLPTSINVTGNSLELTTLSTSITRPSSGWSDTDTVSLNISITNTADDTATVITTAGCVVDLSSAVSTGSYGTKEGNGQVNYSAAGRTSSTTGLSPLRDFSVFVIEDSSTAMTLTGEIRNVAEAISFVQVRCPTANDLFNKRIRVGIVPSMPAATGYDTLYYLFSTNHYYRYANVPNSVSMDSSNNHMLQKWNWAKSDSISVDAISKNISGSSRRKGWVATLNTRDEIVLTNAMNITDAPMIGTSDLATSWTYDAAAWGGSGDIINISQDGDFRWLGPDAWNRKVPTWNASNSGTPGQSNYATTRTGVNFGAQSRYWKSINGVWETATSTSYDIDIGGCDSNIIQSNVNGYGLAHAWHMDANGACSATTYRPTEPNNSGSYVYQGYSGAGGVAGWDDGNPPNPASSTGRNLYVEYCSPTYPCTPPDAAVASISITVDCSSTGQLVNGDFESLPSGITEASNTNNNANNGTWHGYNGQKYEEPRQILFLTDQSDNSTNNFKLPGWSTNNNSNTHRVEIQRFRTGYGPQSSQTGGNTFDNTGPDAANGDYFAEINAENLGTLYQDVRVIPGSTLRWRMYHRGRAISGVDEMKVRIGPASAALSSFYTVATTTYDNSPTRRPSNSGSGASMQDARGSTSLMGGPKSTTDSQTVGGTTGGWGYYEGRYSVGASETSTRFAFVSISVSSGNNSVGNLIDTINFSPLIACPATFSVVAGKTTLINPFDLNLNGNSSGIESTDSLGWDNAFVSETITVNSGSVSRTSYGGVTNRGINYTAPTTTGTYQMDFTIANSFGDQSTSRYIINVIPDTGSRAPGGLPIDPRVTSYNLKLPQITSTTGQVMACLQELNSSGDTITGTIRFDLGTYGSAQETITVLADTVTITGDNSNYLRASGPIDSVNKALEGLRLTRTSNAKFKTYLYVRFSSVVTGLTVGNPTDCSNSRSAAVRSITLRPMTLVEIRRKVITPKNGRS